MSNVTPRTLTGYPATQRLDLSPVIGIDPGARWTGIAVRIGNECNRAVTVHNAATVRRGGHPDLVPVHRHRVVRNGQLTDEDVVQRLIDTVGKLIADPVLDALARAWWANHGLRLLDEETPWFLACELTAEPRYTPDGQREKDGRRYEVTVDEASDYGATNAVAAAVGTALDPLLWIAPRSGDCRDAFGTEDVHDYWPGILLTEHDERVHGIPGRRRCTEHELATLTPKRRDRVDGLGHVRAAYSIATDAGLVLRRDRPGQRPAEVCPPAAWQMRLAALRGSPVTSETPAQRAARSSRSSASPTTAMDRPRTRGSCLMTAMTANVDRPPASFVALPYGELPWRVVTGNPAIRGETDCDGDPLTFTVNTPEDPMAVSVCGGELVWWTVCQAIRMPGSWHPPHNINITRNTADAWLVRAPHGQITVKRTMPRGAIRPSARRSLLAWAGRRARCA